LKPINTIQILDCTLRDGGYYNNWDFSDELVELYLKSINALPINFIEIGYRSIPKKEYAGAYFYLPENLIDSIRDKTNKPLVIILDEKDVSEDNLTDLLIPCIGKIEIVRLAVLPKNLERATALTIKIKELGFKVSINLMYASLWSSSLYEELNHNILNQHLDYFYVVDSYGGLYPDDVKHIFSKLKNKLNIPLGFHGHNNLELALINSLTAIQSGATVVDVTITGMGRGAGNLRTELLLSILHKKNNLSVDFDSLEEVVNIFSDLKVNYNWGTNLSYIVSGVNSLPQTSVISQLKKRYYSLNSIIDNSINKDVTLNSEAILKLFKPNFNVENLLIVGGGNTPLKYKNALKHFLNFRKDIGIIYVSSRNVSIFHELSNIQIHCLPGKEMKRLKGEVSLLNTKDRYFVFPHQKYSNDRSLDLDFEKDSFMLPDYSIFKDFTNSATGMAFEICTILSGKNIYITGFDGYNKKITKEQKELAIENQSVFDEAIQNGLNVQSLTPGNYDVPVESIYSLI